jgi:hypothetical protein
MTVAMQFCCEGGSSQSAASYKFGFKFNPQSASLVAMNQVPPLPGSQSEKQFPWLGCSLGCGALFLLGVFGLLFALLAALELPPFAHDSSRPTVPSDFVGDWRTTGTVEGAIVIFPNGRASCNIKGPSTSFQLNGARARFDSTTETLSIKFWFIGPQWHVDQRPTQRGNATEMILNGQRYFRWTPAIPPGQSPSTPKPWEV